MSIDLGRNRPKRKKKPVTLIVGIIAKDGIVVASDSQTTWGTGKSWDAKKMSEVGHAYGRALVAESGAVITSSQAVEELQRLASIPEEVKKDGLAALLEKTSRHVREKLRHYHASCSSEELRGIIESEGLDFSLMLAHYDHRKETARIDTVSMSVGLASQCKTFYEAVGSGADLAQYLLTELCIPEMNTTTASIIAVHVVEIVKRHDQWCGGPTKLGVLRQPFRELPIPPPLSAPESLSVPELYYQPPLLMSEDEIAEIVAMASEVEIATQAKRGDLIREALSKRSSQRLNEILESSMTLAPKPKT